MGVLNIYISIQSLKTLEVVYIYNMWPYLFLFVLAYFFLLWRSSQLGCCPDQLGRCEVF